MSNLVQLDRGARQLRRCSWTEKWEPVTSNLDEAGSVRIPFKSPWGWSGSGSYRSAVSLVDAGGTIPEVSGVIPTQTEAEQLIEDGGGTIQRIEDAHLPPNPHQYPHINYTTSGGLKGTIQIQGLGT
jgi:hypothetical protein